MDGWMNGWMDGWMDRLSRYARMHLKIIISDEPKIQESKMLIQICFSEVFWGSNSHSQRSILGTDKSNNECIQKEKCRCRT